MGSMPIPVRKGERYGSLVVTKDRRVGWPRSEPDVEVKCDCGTVRRVIVGNLRHGLIKMCGPMCGLKPRKPRRTPFIGPRRPPLITSERGTPTWWSWNAMRKRCLDSGHHGWQYYGGRGVKIHPSWIFNYDQFKADMGPRPEGMTLDRIDVNGNYEPGNCRWATPSQQRRNQRPRR